MITFLAKRDLKLRYQQTLFGVAWALIQPLLGVAIFALVFARVVGFDTGGVPYALFAYAGFVMWSYASSSAEAAARSLVEDRALVERLYFPRVLGPTAARYFLDYSISRSRRPSWPSSLSPSTSLRRRPRLCSPCGCWPAF